VAISHVPKHPAFAAGLPDGRRKSTLLASFDLGDQPHTTGIEAIDAPCHLQFPSLHGFAVRLEAVCKAPATGGRLQDPSKSAKQNASNNFGHFRTRGLRISAKFLQEP
jgi:hypothetical protein